MKLQITIEKLQQILDAAKAKVENDQYLSNTIEIEITNKSETHLGSDTVGCEIKSGYSDCNGEVFFWR